MYVAVKGGEAAIRNAHRLMAHERRGDPDVPELSAAQIDDQLALAVDRVMTEGSLYDRGLAALAIKQARGDLIEAIFLVRAYRATLPRFGATEPLDTSAMAIRRRISATFKDLPGGQILGPTFDYTHRLIDVALDGFAPPEPAAGRADARRRCRASPTSWASEGLIEPSPRDDGAEPGDLTREPLAFPIGRDLRLQALARGDEGFLLALGYSTQRGYGRSHPFVGEIRIGEVEVEIFVPRSWALPSRSARSPSPNARWSTSSRALATRRRSSPAATASSSASASARRWRWRWSTARCAPRELGEEVSAPAQDEEFVLMHCRQCRGHRLRRAPQAAALCRLPVRARSGAPPARRVGRRRGEGGGAMSGTIAAEGAAYNFAYLDEQTKRMIRRAILKAIAIPGYQVPFASREMPMPRRLGHRRRAGHRRHHRPGRRAEGDRPGRRRHHQRRLHPRLLRPRRERRHHHAHRPRRRSSRPATACRRRR